MVTDKEKEKMEEKIEKNNTPIEKLNLSNKIYESLYRAGYRTVEEVVLLTEQDLKNIRGMGKQSIEEVINRLEEFLPGYKIKQEEIPKDNNSTHINMNDPIKKLNLSTLAYTRLRRSGYNTVEEILLLTEQDLEKIKGMGKKSIKEVMDRVAELSIHKQKQDKEILEENPIIDAENSQEIVLRDEMKDVQSEKDIAEIQMENDLTEKHIGKTELEILKAKRDELQESLRKLEEQTRKSKELLASYEKIINSEEKNNESSINHGEE